MPVKKPETRPLSDPRHLLRYLKSQAGSSPAEIARQEHVSVATVRSSITQVENYRRRNTKEEADFALREFLISSITTAKSTLEGLLKATELVEVNDSKTGMKKVITVDDKVTRLEAMKIVSSIISSTQAKEPPVVVNNTVSQTNQTANITNTVETNEERFRRLRQKQQEFNALPAEVVAVPDRIDSGKASGYDGDDDEDDEEDDTDEE